MYLETVFRFYVFLYHFIGNSLFRLVRLGSFSDIIKRYFALTLAKLDFYFDCTVCFLWDNNTTVSTWLELMALMSYYFARLWKHISSIFGTIGRREHIQRFLTILRNFGMREPINGILNTSLLEIKGRLYRLLHIINEFSHLRIHSFPLINIPS